MKSMTRAQKWMLVVNLLLIVLIGVAGYYTWNAKTILADVRSEASYATQQLERIEAQLAKAIVPPDLAELNQAIPVDWQIARFFADLTMLSNEYEIQIFSVSPGEPIQPAATPSTDDALDGQEDMTEESEGEGDTSDGTETVAVAESPSSYSQTPPSSLPNVYTLPLSIELKGNITEVLSFMDRLQQLQRLVWVTGFELLALDPEQDIGLIYETPMDLRIHLYIYSKGPWDPVELQEKWPFDIQPAHNKESFDAR